MGILYGLAEGFSRGLSNWITYDMADNNGHKTEKILFKAKKIHVRAMKIYETSIEILDNTYITVTNNKETFKFSKSEITFVDCKKTPLITKIDIIRFIIAGIMCFIPSPPVLYGLFAGALFFYCTLINTIRIHLVNGETVNVYYMFNDDANFLISKLN